MKVDPMRFATWIKIASIAGESDLALMNFNENLTFSSRNQADTVAVVGEVSPDEFDEYEQIGQVIVKSMWEQRIKKKFANDTLISINLSDGEITFKGLSSGRTFKDALIAAIDRRLEVDAEREEKMYRPARLSFNRIFRIDIGEFKDLTDSEVIKLIYGDELIAETKEGTEEYRQPFRILDSEGEGEGEVDIDVAYVKRAIDIFKGDVYIAFSGNVTPIAISKVEKNQRVTMFIAPRMV